MGQTVFVHAALGSTRARPLAPAGTLTVGGLVARLFERAFEARHDERQVARGARERLAQGRARSRRELGSALTTEGERGGERQRKVGLAQQFAARLEQIVEQRRGERLVVARLGVGREAEAQCEQRGVGAARTRFDLAGANLDDADLARAQLGGARLRGASLRRADLRNANLAEAELDSADLGAARLDGANLEEATLTRARLIEASARGANFEEARLGDADLSLFAAEGANLEEAVLRRSRLEGARFDGADLDRVRGRAAGPPAGPCR